MPSSAPPFQLFGTDHLVVLFLTVITAAILIYAVRRWGEESVGTKRSLQVLAWMLLLSYPAKVAAFVAAKEPLLDNGLPMHLCNWAAIMGFLALTTKRQLFCELLYFWGLAATLQAVITPNVPYGFPHPIFFVFFTVHSGVVIAAVVVAFGMCRQPQRGGVSRAFLGAQVYFIIAGLTNLLIGSNYGFLRKKPETASLIDHLGAWPYYIVALEILALVLFALLNLPFLKKQRQALT
ncbi:MAG: putative integral membrane protein (TIGR02206 family) [Verrucomicrobiales bacterium]|jgi:hypothetical integral membrane protein (TIGR02206 family)